MPMPSIMPELSSPSKFLIAGLAEGNSTAMEIVADTTLSTKLICYLAGKPVSEIDHSVDKKEVSFDGQKYVNFSLRLSETLLQRISPHYSATLVVILHNNFGCDTIEFKLIRQEGMTNTAINRRKIPPSLVRAKSASNFNENAKRAGAKSATLPYSVIPSAALPPPNLHSQQSISDSGISEAAAIVSKQPPAKPKRHLLKTPKAKFTEINELKLEVEAAPKEVYEESWISICDPVLVLLNQYCDPKDKDAVTNESLSDDNGNSNIDDNAVQQGKFSLKNYIIERSPVIMESAVENIASPLHTSNPSSRSEDENRDDANEIKRAKSDDRLATAAPDLNDESAFRRTSARSSFRELKEKFMKFVPKDEKVGRSAAINVGCTEPQKSCENTENFEGALLSDLGNKESASIRVRTDREKNDGAATTTRTDLLASKSAGEENAKAGNKREYLQLCDMVETTVVEYILNVSTNDVAKKERPPNCDEEAFEEKTDNCAENACSPDRCVAAPGSSRIYDDISQSDVNKEYISSSDEMPYDLQDDVSVNDVNCDSNNATSNTEYDIQKSAHEIEIEQSFSRFQSDLKENDVAFESDYKATDYCEILKCELSDHVSESNRRRNKVDDVGEKEALEACETISYTIDDYDVIEFNIIDNAEPVLKRNENLGNPLETNKAPTNSSKIAIDTGAVSSKFKYNLKMEKLGFDVTSHVKEKNSCSVSPASSISMLSSTSGSLHLSSSSEHSSSPTSSDSNLVYFMYPDIKKMNENIKSIKPVLNKTPKLSKVDKKIYPSTRGNINKRMAKIYINDIQNNDCNLYNKSDAFKDKIKSASQKRLIDHLFPKINDEIKNTDKLIEILQNCANAVADDNNNNSVNQSNHIQSEKYNVKNSMRNHSADEFRHETKDKNLKNKNFENKENINFLEGENNEYYSKEDTKNAEINSFKMIDDSEGYVKNNFAKILNDSNLNNDNNNIISTTLDISAVKDNIICIDDLESYRKESEVQNYADDAKLDTTDILFENDFPNILSPSEDLWSACLEELKKSDNFEISHNIEKFFNDWTCNTVNGAVFAEKDEDTKINNENNTNFDENSDLVFNADSEILDDSDLKDIYNKYSVTMDKSSISSEDRRIENPGEADNLENNILDSDISTNSIIDLLARNSPNCLNSESLEMRTNKLLSVLKKDVAEDLRRCRSPLLSAEEFSQYIHSDLKGTDLSNDRTQRLYDKGGYLNGYEDENENESSTDFQNLDNDSIYALDRSEKDNFFINLLTNNKNKMTLRNSRKFDKWEANKPDRNNNEVGMNPLITPQVIGPPIEICIGNPLIKNDLSNNYEIEIASPGRNKNGYRSSDSIDSANYSESPLKNKFGAMTDLSGDALFLDTDEDALSFSYSLPTIDEDEQEEYAGDSSSSSESRDSDLEEEILDARVTVNRVGIGSDEVIGCHEGEASLPNDLNCESAKNTDPNLNLDKTDENVDVTVHEDFYDLNEKINYDTKIIKSDIHGCKKQIGDKVMLDGKNSQKIIENNNNNNNNGNNEVSTENDGNIKDSRLIIPDAVSINNADSHESISSENNYIETKPSEDVEVTNLLSTNLNKLANKLGRLGSLLNEYERTKLDDAEIVNDELEDRDNKFICSIDGTKAGNFDSKKEFDIKLELQNDICNEKDSQFIIADRTKVITDIDPLTVCNGFKDVNYLTSDLISKSIDSVLNINNILKSNIDNDVFSKANPESNEINKKFIEFFNSIKNLNSIENSQQTSYNIFNTTLSLNINDFYELNKDYYSIEKYEQKLLKNQNTISCQNHETFKSDSSSINSAERSVTLRDAGDFRHSINNSTEGLSTYFNYENEASIIDTKNLGDDVSAIIIKEELKPSVFKFADAENQISQYKSDSNIHLLGKLTDNDNGENDIRYNKNQSFNSSNYDDNAMPCPSYIDKFYTANTKLETVQNQAHQNNFIDLNKDFEHPTIKTKLTVEAYDSQNNFECLKTKNNYTVEGNGVKSVKLKRFGSKDINDNINFVSFNANMPNSCNKIIDSNPQRNLYLNNYCAIAIDNHKGDLTKLDLNLPKSSLIDVHLNNKNLFIKRYVASIIQNSIKYTLLNDIKSDMKNHLIDSHVNNDFNEDHVADMINLFNDDLISDHADNFENYSRAIFDANLAPTDCTQTIIDSADDKIFKNRRDNTTRNKSLKRLNEMNEISFEDIIEGSAIGINSESQKSNCTRIERDTSCRTDECHAIKKLNNKNLNDDMLNDDAFKNCALNSEIIFDVRSFVKFIIQTALGIVNAENHLLINNCYNVKNLDQIYKFHGHAFENADISNFANEIISKDRPNKNDIVVHSVNKRKRANKYLLVDQETSKEFSEINTKDYSSIFKDRNLFAVADHFDQEPINYIQKQTHQNRQIVPNNYYVISEDLMDKNQKSVDSKLIPNLKDEKFNENLKSSFIKVLDELMSNMPEDEGQTIEKSNSRIKSEKLFIADLTAHHINCGNNFQESQLYLDNCNINTHSLDNIVFSQNPLERNKAHILQNFETKELLLPTCNNFISRRKRNNSIEKYDNQINQNQYKDNHLEITCKSNSQIIGLNFDVEKNNEHIGNIVNEVSLLYPYDSANNVNRRVLPRNAMNMTKNTNTKNTDNAIFIAGSNIGEIESEQDSKQMVKAAIFFGGAALLGMVAAVMKSTK